MLQKILHIRKVGLFEDACSKAVSLGRFAVIYGENGRGKSTLSATMRAAKTGNIDLIRRKSTLYSTGPHQGQEVGFLFKRGNSAINVEFASGKWSSVFGNVEVFDADFIEEYVYSGSEVRADQRENLLNFTLGEEAAQIRDEVESIGERMAQAKTAASGYERDLNLIAKPLGLTHSAYIALLEDAGWSKEIDSLEAQKVRIKEQSKYGRLLSPEPIALPVNPFASIKDDLEMSLSDVEDNAEQQVKQQLAEHKGHSYEQWLGTGQQFAAGSDCPYCGQDIAESGLVRAYQLYFNEAYRGLKQRLEDHKKRVDETWGDQAFSILATKVKRNDEKIQSWTDISGLNAPAIDLEALQKAFHAVHAQAADLLSQKVGQILEPINLGDVLAAAPTYESICTALSTYNQCISQLTHRISAFKANLEGENEASVERQIQVLRDKKKRFHADTIALIKDYHKADAQHSQESRNKQDANKRLDEATRTILERYCPRVNELLAKMNADFKIDELGTAKQGGTHRTTYFLNIRGYKVALGDREAAKTQPSFGNVLSEADKRVLALAFFLARLDEHSDLTNQVVIIDDPVSSMDDTRRTATKELIFRYAERCAQMIVLTHDKRFARDLWHGAGNVNLLSSSKTISSICRRASGSILVPDLDIDKECADQYEKAIRDLDDYVTNGPTGHNLTVVHSQLRIALEGSIKHRYFGVLGGSETLDRIIEIARPAVQGDALYMDPNVLAELYDLNKKTLNSHHVDSKLVNPTTITDQELKRLAERTLSFIRR